MLQPEKYGDRYKEVRKQRIQDKGYASELSGRTDETVHSHHTHPQCLGFFQYGDYRDALLLVARSEHEAIHMKIAKSKKYLQMIDARMQTARRLWKDPGNETLKEKLREYDRELIPAYIKGVLDDMDLDDEVTHETVFQTLVNSFSTNRDLMVDIHQKEVEILELQKEKERILAELQKVKKEFQDRIDSVVAREPIRKKDNWLE